jgi:hypothetical protein
MFMLISGFGKCRDSRYCEKINLLLKKKLKGRQTLDRNLSGLFLPRSPMIYSSVPSQKNHQNSDFIINQIIFRKSRRKSFFY